MGKGKTIRSPERNIILKVLTFFENEKANKRILIPVDQAVQRTCAATGVSKRTLMRFKKEAEIAASSSDSAEPSLTSGAETERITPERVMVKADMESIWIHTATDVGEMSSMQVKTEPVDSVASEESQRTVSKSEEEEPELKVDIKAEPADEASGERLQEYYLELYPEHKVKEELVIGPEVIQSSPNPRMKSLLGD